MNSQSPKDIVQRLREQLGRQEAVTLGEDVTRFSSGVAALDRLLPGGGLRHGMLVEWLGGKSSSAVVQQRSSGVGGRKPRNYSTTPLPHYSTTPLLHYSSAVTLSLLAAREACRQGGVLVVIDRERTFYPPAAAAWGIDLARLIVVHPQTTRDALWAAVQSLRSPIVAAMWIAVDRLDDRAFRRLQLAASDGRTLGLLVRPASIRGQPSWADITLAVRNLASRAVLRPGRVREQPGPAIRNPKSEIRNLLTLNSHRLVHIHITRSRGARPGGHATLEIDDATHTVREVKEGFRLSAVGYQPSLLADSR